MGLKQEMEWTPKRYNTNRDLDLELTPKHDLRWDIDGTGAGDGVDPQKVQHKYGSKARSGVDPPHTCSKVRHRWDWSQRWSGPPKGTTQIGIWIWSWPPKHDLMWDRWDWSWRWSGPSKGMAQIWIQSWIWSWPPHTHVLGWDIDGTEARDGVDPEKVQHKYGSKAESRSRVDPHMQYLRWDIDGTGARDEVDLQKVQHNMDLELDPGLEFTLHTHMI